MIWWEYVGEELALFWESPYGHGREKIATFWWPLHPPEMTKEVERLFEQIATSASTPKPSHNGLACRYGDPICPCQDGDMCHYEGPDPMTPPTPESDSTGTTTQQNPNPDKLDSCQTSSD